MNFEGPVNLFVDYS